MERYRQGDASVAPAALSLDKKAIQQAQKEIFEDAARALQAARDQPAMMAIRRHRIRLALAMVLFHTDAALRATGTAVDDQIGLARGPIEELDPFAADLQLAMQPVGRLTPDDIRDVIHQWYVVAALILRQMDRPTLDWLVNIAHERYPHDPIFSLLWGNALERVAGGAVVDVSLVRDLYQADFVRTWRQTLYRAGRLYEDALDADPTATEARVRLGRVELLAGDRKKARGHLEQALGEAQTPRLRYLAALFLGAVADVDGRPDEAAKHYAQALSIVPGAQSAAFAMSRIADAAGDTDAARDWLNRTLAIPFKEREDPWETYYEAPEAGSLLDRLAALREYLRR